MLFIIQGLLGLVLIGELICMIMVLIKMFQAGEQTLGIICIVLLLCCGVGHLVVFVFGWINSAKWNVKNVMMIWTGLLMASLSHPVRWLFLKWEGFVPSLRFSLWSNFPFLD